VKASKHCHGPLARNQTESRENQRKGGEEVALALIFVMTKENGEICSRRLFSAR
jgi:hypothetical protein